MSSLPRIPLVSLATLALAVTAHAQEAASDTARLTPVTVTATRSPLPADRTPSSVTVVTGEALRRGFPGTPVPKELEPSA